MNDSQTPPSNDPPAKGIAKTALIVIGILMAISLPFVPWLARGLNQQRAEKAVVAAGGRASYGKYLLDEADYFRDGKQRGKSFFHDLLGDAFTEQLTLVELRSEVPRGLVMKLARLPDLEILDVGGANFEDADVALLTDCDGLKKLWLSGSRVTGEGVQSISQLPQLMSLNLDDVQLDDGAVAALGNHPELRRLYLARTNVTDEGIGKLAGLSKLLGIGLEGTGVTDNAMEHLAKLSTLKELRLGDTAITDSGAKQLGQLQHLKSVNLENTQLSTEGLSWLADCQNLEIVDIAGTEVTDGIINVLAAMPKLVSVSLRRTAVTPAAIEELKRSVGRNVTVQSDLGDQVLAQ